MELSYKNMIDHITIRVSDLEKSKVFYDVVLATLDLKIVLGSEEKGYWGYGENKDPIFEISNSDKDNPPHKKIHIAFKAKSKEMVDVFYKAAMSAGASDNGKPGLRTEYTPRYYAAFVRDLDGNNIEACVC